MSSGAGHIMDMMNRIKQNTALKASRRNKFKGGNSYSNVSNSKTEYDFPNVLNSELELIKSKIRNEAKKANRKQFANWVLISLIIVIFFFNYYHI